MPQTRFHKIITLTGASGAGKTSVARKLLELAPDLKMVISWSSREPRPSDIHGEYNCNVPPELFEKDKDKFLWTVRVHGNTCGTLKESVDLALKSDSPSIMILVPWAVKIMLQYTYKVLPCYITSPAGPELERRLKARGESDSFIEKRVNDCREWDDEAAAQSTIPYLHVPNEERDAGVEKAARMILEVLH